MKQWIIIAGLVILVAVILLNTKQASEGFQTAESVAAIATPPSPSSAVSKDQMIQTVREIARLLPLIEQGKTANMNSLKELTSAATATKAEEEIAKLAKYKDGSSQQADMLQRLQGFDTMPAEEKTRLQTQLYIDYSKTQVLYTMFVVTLQANALNPARTDMNITAQALISLMNNLENLIKAEASPAVMNPAPAVPAAPPPAPASPIPPPPAPTIEPAPPSPIPPSTTLMEMPAAPAAPAAPAPPPPAAEGFQSGGNPYNAPSPNLQQAFEFRLGKRQIVDSVMQNANSR